MLISVVTTEISVSLGPLISGNEKYEEADVKTECIGWIEDKHGKREKKILKLNKQYAPHSYPNVYLELIVAVIRRSGHAILIPDASFRVACMALTKRKVPPVFLLYLSPGHSPSYYGFRRSE